MDIHEETHCTTREKVEMMQMFFITKHCGKKQKQEAQGIWHFALQDGRQWRQLDNIEIKVYDSL